MTIVKKVVHNFVIQIISRSLALVLGLFIIALLMRYLGLKNYGYYSTAIAFLQVFGIIADFGLYLTTLCYLGEIDILEEQEKKVRTEWVMNNIFTLRFFSALVFYGGAFFLCLFLPYPGIVKLATGILSGSLFFCTLIQILSAFYQKILQTEKIFLGEVLGKVITLILMVIFVWQNLGFYLVLCVFVIGNFFNFLVLFLSARKKIFLRFKFDFVFWREILKRAWPAGLAIILNILYFKADTLILSFYYPPEVVGIYGSCYRILEVLITVPPLFLGLILPKLISTWQNKENDKLKNLVQKSFDFLIMISLPMILGTVVLGRKIMILIGGPEFGLAGDVLRVIIIAAGVLFVAELFKHLAVGLGKQRQVLPFYLVTAALSLIGYFIFIPDYSYWGAAWVTVFSECLMFVFVFCLFRQTTKISLRLNFFAKSLGASLIMFCALTLLRDSNLFFLIILGVVVYGLCLYLLGGLNKDLLKEVLNFR